MLLLWSTTISGIGGVILGFLVLLKAPKKIDNIFFSLVSIIISLVVVANYFSLTRHNSPEQTLFWIRAVMFLVPYLMFSLYYFAISYLRDGFKLNKKTFFLLLLATIFVSIVNLTSWTYLSVSFSEAGAIIPKTGIGMPLNGLFILPLFVLSIYFMAKNIRQMTLGKERNMVKFALYSFLISFGIQIITSFVLVAIFNYTSLVPLGNFLTFLFVSLMTIAIFYLRAFRINVVGTVLFAGILSILTFADIVTANGLQEIVYKSVVFVAVSLIGYALVRSVLREIEIRKKLEELTKQLEEANEHLQELDQMKTEFISIASHELLTPISAILGYLSMILDEKIVPVENEKTKKFLDNVYTSAKRLAKLVEDLLNVSRIEQGRIVVDRQAIDPVKAAKEVIAETLPKAKEANLTLEFEEPKETIPKVYADFDKVKEILVNIVGNALKFTKKGGVTISLKTSRDEEVQGKRGKGNYVIVSVKDTGVGIPKEEQANIFKKFSRAGRWATRDVQGTGLGLYVSKSLIEMLGGKIWVDSEAGKGATFSISLSEVREEDKREISGDVAKLGQPEQKELVDKGEVKHAKLKPTASPNDTSRKMKRILELSKKDVERIQKCDIDKKQFDK